MDVKVPVTPALSAAVADEIKRQGMPTHDELRDRGGPSSPTLTKILGGSGTISRSTARKLDTALRWRPGKTWALATGGPLPSEVKHAREERGWSVPRMARELQVGPLQVERYESGEDVPPDRVTLLLDLFTVEEAAEAVRRATGN